MSATTEQPATKTCTGPCGETKPLASFPTKKSSPDGRADECRACRQARLHPGGKPAPASKPTSSKPSALSVEADDQAVQALLDRLEAAHDEAAVLIESLTSAQVKRTERIKALRSALSPK